MNGEVIESYKSAKPYPCYLIYGNVDTRILHILIGWDVTDETVYVITAYEPDEHHFEADLKTRRRDADD